MIKNKDFRRGLLNLPINEIFTFYLGDEFKNLTGGEIKKTMDYMGALKYVESEKPLTVIKTDLENLKNDFPKFIK